MIDQIYIDILNSHKKFKSYKEDLERDSESYVKNLIPSYISPFDMEYLEGAKQRQREKNKKEKAKEPTQEPATQSTNLDASSKEVMINSIKTHVEGIVFAYLLGAIFDRIKKASPEEVKKLIGKQSKGPDFDSTVNNLFINKLKIKDFDAQREYTADDIANGIQMSNNDPVQNKIFALVANPNVKNNLSHLFQNNPNVQNIISDVYKEISNQLEQLSKQEGRKDKINGFLFRNMNYAKTLFDTMIRQNNLNEKEKNNVISYLKISYPQYAEKLGGIQTILTGTLLMNEAIDILQRNAKFDAVSHSVYDVLNNNINTLNQMFSKASQNVFKDPSLIGKLNPKKDDMNEEVFNKEKLYNFFNEHFFEATTPAPKNTVQAPVSNSAATVKTPDPKQAQVQPDQKDQEQEQKDIAKQGDVNKLATYQTSALKTAVATVIMTIFSTYMITLQKYLKEHIDKGKTTGSENTVSNEELLYSEGIVDFIGRGIGKVELALQRTFKSFFSIIPTNIYDLKDKTIFNQVMMKLLSQSKNDQFVGLMSQFNASEQGGGFDGRFDDKIFNDETLDSISADEYHTIIGSTTGEVSQAIKTTFNSTNLQKIIQNAYSANMPQAAKTALKIKNSLDSYKNINGL